MAEKIISPGVFLNESDQSLVQKGIQGTATSIVGPTVKGRPLIPTYVTSYSEFDSIFGSTFKSGSYYYEYFTSLAAKEFFQSGGKTLLITRIISGSNNINTYANATIPTLSGTGSAFSLETLSWGNIMNNTSSLVSGALSSGTSTNVRWEVTNINSGSGTFNLVIRRGDDNDSNKNVLETWANLSLDPSLSNFISRVIGDQKPTYVAATGTDSAYVSYTGSYGNASQYVRVSAVSPQIDSIDNNGSYKSTQYSGSLPAVGSGSYGGSFNGGVAPTDQTQLMNENIIVDNVQGYGVSDYQAAFALLSNKDEYQFNVLVAPGVGLTHGAVTTLISTCEGRGDSISIVDDDVYGVAISTAANNSSAQSSNYAAAYYPWVQVFSSNLGKAVWVPPSVVVVGAYAFNDQVGAEWFAVAGLNRGGIPSVLKAERRLQQSDRDTLYNSNINPLATFPGEGVVIWGQKTLQKRQTSLDRVSVRRLLINLKGFIGQVARNLVFEQNTTVTRNRFLSQVNPYLDSVVQRQGLYAYKVVMDDSNNTADVIDRNQLVGQIYIQPTKTAEFIVLDFNVLPTGATFPQ